MVIITPSFGKYFWMALPGFRRRRLFPVVVRGGGIMVMVFVIAAGVLALLMKGLI